MIIISYLKEWQMDRKAIAVLCLIVFSFALMGCATTNPDGAPSAGQSAAGGAVAGAVAGGVIGALCGLIPGGGIAAAVARGAVAGASTGLVAGIASGFVYGKFQEKMYRDRVAAEAYYQYKNGDGEKVIVENVDIQPGDPVQGTSASLNATFTVLCGTDDAIPVEVMQTVVADNKVCGQPLSNKADRKSGTYVISVPMDIPNNTPVGKYQLLTLVKTTKAADQKMYDFMVNKKSTPEQQAPAEQPAPQEKPSTGEEPAGSEAKTG
jgi:hypothetical protein